MSDWAYCPKCATPLPPDATACPACGARTPSAATVPSNGGAEAEPTDDDLQALEAALEKALSPSYILVRRLGTGGMGSVFLARDPALKRLVAVKVLAPALAADEAARARFEREAQAVARLSHPNIVAIHSVGQLDDGTPYFVMQHVAGQSLAARLAEEGPFSPDETRRILGDVASALAAAHAQGIIHRDIKPANVLYDDESGRVMVSDFGIAAVRPVGEQPQQTKLTMTGMAVGTPQYMSPEQLLAEEVTEKTDIYALGLLGYELTTGVGPFQATSPQELIAAHLRDRPKPLSETRDDVDPELESAIGQCLTKDPEQRPTARDIAQRFTLGADRVLEWPPPGLAALHGRLRPVSNLFAVGSLLMALGFFWLVWRGPELSSAVTSFFTLFIWLLGTAGAFTLFAAALKILRIGKEATRAVRTGFGWLTVAETLADRRGDTGALIAGVREYAALEPDARARLRRLRLVAETALLLGGLMPLLAILPYVWLAGVGAAGADAAPLILLAPSVLLVVVARVAQRRETRAVGKARKHLSRHRRTREEDPSVVRAWNETLDDVRRGQRMGAGSTRRPLTGRAAAFGMVLAPFVVIALVTPIALVGVIGPGLWQAAVPKFANVADRIRVANAARSFVLPPDSTITPLEAGRAFYALHMIGESSPPESPFPQRPLPVMYEEGWFDQPFPDELFLRASDGQEVNDARTGHPVNGPSVMTVLEYAAGGLSADERAYLERLAAHAGWDAYRTVARAPSVDFIGGRFELPFPNSVSVWALPIPRFRRIREAAYASVSKAALHLAEGRYDAAETTLRETISLGFALIDNGTSVLEGLIGVVVVGIGRDALERYYELVGRPEAAVLRARYDSVTALSRELEQLTPGVNIGDMTALRRRMLSLVTDPDLIPGYRFEQLVILSLAPCTNVSELLFGPDEDIQGAFELAERELVHFESDRELLRLIRETPYRWSPIPDNPVFKLVSGLGQVSGWVFGDERIPACTGWVTQGFDLLNVAM